MPRLTLIVTAAVLTGLAQDTGGNAPAKIDPTRMKALENALTGANLGRVQPEPNWLRTPQVRRIKPFQSQLDWLRTPGARRTKPKDVIVITQSDGAGRCAHIRIIPVDPKIDPDMLIEVPKDGGATSRMPVIKGLPPCPADLK